MDPVLFVKQLPLVNLVFLAAMFIYLISKARRHGTVLLFSVSLVPLLVVQLGTHLFVASSSRFGPLLIVFGVSLIPLTLTPLSHVIGREPQKNKNIGWMVYYTVQAVLLTAVTAEIVRGNVVEWVTGILDQPVILLEKSRRF